MATVVNKCTTVAGRTPFNADGEDVTALRKHSSDDGGMFVTKCADEATLEISVSNVAPAMAFSMPGHDVTVSSNKTMSADPSSKIIMASPIEANKACATIGRKANAGEPVPEYRAESNWTINGNGTSFRLVGVNDSFIRKLSSTSIGMSFSNFGDDNKTFSRDSSVDAGIKSNKHGEEAARAVNVTSNSAGKALSSDREPKIVSRSVSTFAGTMHMSDGDTECTAVNRPIIFAYGRTVNVFVIATIVLANTGRGNSPKRQGFAIKTSMKFSIPVTVRLLTTFTDFNGFNKTVYTDAGIEHNVHDATVDKARKNRTNGYVGKDSVKTSLDDIRVIRFMITPGGRRRSVDGDVDKTSNKVVTVRWFKVKNKHGHLDIAVVSSVILLELKLLNVPSEVNEFVIALIASGDNE